MLNGVEVEGGGGVKWLATGVWRPASLEKDPMPVDRQRISPEKMDVFKKVRRRPSSWLQISLS